MASPKLTPKQEAFAKAYIETGNASEAYRRSYNASRMKDQAVHVNASKLLANAKVALRVQALQTAHQKRHEVTVDSLVTELEQARVLALKIEAPAAMVAATMGKGKLLGLVIDKNEHAGKNGGPIETKELSDIEAAQRVAYMLGRAMERQRNAASPAA